MNFKKWKLKTKASPYSEYGKVFKVSWLQLVIFLDCFIPTFKIPTLLALRYKNKLSSEAFRVNIHSH